MCPWNRDVKNNKCLKKGESPPSPTCTNYYDKLECYKEFNNEPFEYKVTFNEVSLDFGESPYYLMAFKKDKMDLALK
jgi:hypothetical protein